MKIIVMVTIFLLAACNGGSPDLDRDNDGVFNTVDLFPDDPLESVDTDSDGIGNNADLDDDNDGVTDEVDDFPLDASEAIDTDSDGIGNNADEDDDNDGVFDDEDVFSLDPSEYADYDGDGVGNFADVFVTNPNEWADSDGDGFGDNGDVFPYDPTVSGDHDQDSIGNNVDPDFPRLAYQASENQHLVDFKLSVETQYWEVRNGQDPYVYPNYNVIAQYDEEIWQNLNALEQDALQSASANTGFRDMCALGWIPDGCLRYAVALTSGSIITINTKVALLDFFGEIDTVAELAFWLSQRNEWLRFYRITEFGYQVLATENFCGNITDGVSDVYKDGTVVQLEVVAYENDGTVC